MITVQEMMSVINHKLHAKAPLFNKYSVRQVFSQFFQSLIKITIIKLHEQFKKQPNLSLSNLTPNRKLPNILFTMEKIVYWLFSDIFLPLVMNCRSRFLTMKFPVKKKDVQKVKHVFRYSKLYHM